MFARLKSCERSGYKKDDGWIDMGLFCFQVPKCKTGSGADFLKVWDWKCRGGNTAFKEAECPPGQEQAREYKKVAALAAKSTSDAVGGMCYKPCPKDMPNHILSAPYLCFKDSVGRGLSYGRGAGDIPPPFVLGPG
jgi:hypothetical protein